MIAPVYDQMSASQPDVRFLKVDIDSPALAATVKNHSISSVVSSRMRCFGPWTAGLANRVGEAACRSAHGWQ